MATGYEPLGTLKPVADDLWIVDGPPPPGGGCRFPTRATVVRLEDGTFWVQSPTPLTHDLRAEIDALGPVAHLVAPNRWHVHWMPDWAGAYPDAAVWAAPGGDLPVAKALHPTRAEAAWSSQIEQIIPRGHASFQEAVFFHRASRTLIVADLVQALETAKLRPMCRPLVWITGVDDSDGKMPFGLRRGFRDKDALAEDIETMIGWGPRRVILSHGRWYASNGAGELERAFRKVLRARAWDRALAEQKAREGAGR